MLQFLWVLRMLFRVLPQYVFFFGLLKTTHVFCLLKLSPSLRIRTVRPSSYHEAKQAAVEYHSAKQTLFKAFQKAGLGAWVKKPIEQDQFSVTT